MATVLQQRIEAYKKQIAICKEPDCQTCKELRTIVRDLEAYLPAEEQQIRDTWEAADNFITKERWEVNPNLHPDLETYINNLKQQK